MTDETATILVVEDDAPVRTFLADNLTADGYEVLVAGTARDALRLLEYRRPDLAVVDLGLPDGSGLDLLRRVRDGGRRRLPARSRRCRWSCSPAAPARSTASAASSAAPTTSCAKPFSYGELRLRVWRGPAAHASAPGAAAGCASATSRSTRRRARSASAAGAVALAQKEFALLRALAAEPTRVFTKEELLRDVWGFRSMGATRTLDSHACRLRHKLGRDGDRYVVNVWGVGYRLIDGPVEVAVEAHELAAVADRVAAGRGGAGRRRAGAASMASAGSSRR